MAIKLTHGVGDMVGGITRIKLTHGVGNMVGGLQGLNCNKEVCARTRYFLFSVEGCWQENMTLDIYLQY